MDPSKRIQKLCTKKWWTQINPLRNSCKAQLQGTCPTGNNTTPSVWTSALPQQSDEVELVERHECEMDEMEDGLEPESDEDLTGALHGIHNFHVKCGIRRLESALTNGFENHEDIRAIRKVAAQSLRKICKYRFRGYSLPSRISSSLMCLQNSFPITLAMSMDLATRSFFPVQLVGHRYISRFHVFVK